jgi:hypothetical protein
VSAELEREGPAPQPAAAPAALDSQPIALAGNVGAVLALQRNAGNQAVGRMLGTRRATVARLVEDRAASHPELRQQPTMVRGPHAIDVELLQRRLNEDGATPPLNVDGIFGPLTHNATVAFQGRHGLEANGVVELRTWGMIDELQRQGIAGPQSTVLDQTTPVTQTQHDDVEAILHPGHSGGVAGPAMTGAGAGGEYETRVLAALDALATRTLARPVATPAVDMNHANRVSDVAQREVEAFFGSAITLASRKPTGDWHPGSNRMGLADATTRPMDDQDALGWTEYFMDNGSYDPAQIARSLHYDGTRATPDRAEHDRVRDLWLTTHDGLNTAKAMARTWPAEASTGTVFLQLRDPAYQDRVGMWRLFGTLVHEFLHIVTHPNYGNAADAIGGGARDILIEGMDDHMRAQVWPAVRARAAGDAALRTTVEGPFFNATANPADYAAGSAIDTAILNHHYASMADADRIAAKVGEANARAAFFMGHVEALGLGAGSASEHPLTGLATWTPGGGGAPDTYVVPPAGETVQQVRDRTGATQITDAGGTAQADPAHSFAGGEVLTIPGLRWHTGIDGDTRGQVATQHGITQAQLEHANGLPAAAPTTAVAAGTLLLIPVHP